MTWTWPLRDVVPAFPDEPGRFGAVRRHDVHTGIDLYCEIGQEVVAVEDGVVVAIEGFTGPNADDPSPWWNDTQAVLVEGESGVVVYGEVSSRVWVGMYVRAGSLVGVIETPVLKKDKGRPTTMLHLELMKLGARETVWWGIGEPQPVFLQDPTPHLTEAGGHRTPPSA